MNKRSGIFVLISFCFNSIILCVHERHPGAGWAREHSISDEYAKKRITDRHYGHLNGIYDKIEHLYDPDEEDEDGGEIASIAAREAMYGTNYTNDPAFGQHYIDQVEAKMQSVVVGESWASLGPTYSPYSFLDSGRVRCILQHPTKLDIVYVLTTGGLLKTINFFVSSPTWIPLTDQLVTTSGGYAAFGSDPETIYLGLGDPFDRGGAGGYFTKSTDGGATWSPPVDLTPFRVTDESDGSTLTREYGWRSQFHTPVQWLKTGNNGVSWWIAYDHLNILLIVSSDTGVTWGALAGTNWDTMVGTNAGRTTFAVGIPGDSIIYAQVAKSSDSTQLDILKSVNGGITWTSCHCNSNYAPTTKINNLLSDLNTMGSQGWYNQMLLVDPSDVTQNTVYAGVVYGLSYIHADFHTAAYAKSPDGIATLIFGTDGSVFVSQNSGSSWTSEKNRGLVTQLPNFICGSQLLNILMIGLQDLGTRERVGKDTNTGDGDGCAYSQALNKVSILSLYYNYIECCNYDNNIGAIGDVTDCSSGITDVQRPFFTNVRTPSAAADPTGAEYLQVFYAVRRLVWNSIGTVGSNGISDGDIPGIFQTIGIGPTTTDQVAFAKDMEICITTNGGASWTTVKIFNTIPGWGYGTSPLWASFTVLYMSADNPTLGVSRFIKSTDTGATWSSPNTEK
eukprot:gene1567-3033_t